MVLFTTVIVILRRKTIDNLGESIANLGDTIANLGNTMANGASYDDDMGPDGAED